MLGTVLDLTMIVLLLVTSFWCVRVHRRLAALRTGQSEIAAFVDALAAATERAERAVQEMKEAGSQAAASREAQESELRTRREELQRTLEAAQRMQRRLEDVLGHGARLIAELRTDPRGSGTESAPPEPSAPEPSESRPPELEEPARRRPARDLLQALQKLR